MTVIHPDRRCNTFLDSSDDLSPTLTRSLLQASREGLCGEGVVEYDDDDWPTYVHSGASSAQPNKQTDQSLSTHTLHCPIKRVSVDIAIDGLVSSCLSTPDASQGLLLWPPILPSYIERMSSCFVRLDGHDVCSFVTRLSTMFTTQLTASSSSSSFTISVNATRASKCHRWILHAFNNDSSRSTDIEVTLYSTETSAVFSAGRDITEDNNDNEQPGSLVSRNTSRFVVEFRRHSGDHALFRQVYVSCVVSLGDSFDGPFDDSFAPVIPSTEACFKSFECPSLPDDFISTTESSYPQRDATAAAALSCILDLATGDRIDSAVEGLRSLTTDCMNSLVCHNDVSNVTHRLICALLEANPLVERDAFDPKCPRLQLTLACMLALQKKFPLEWSMAWVGLIRSTPVIMDRILCALVVSSPCSSVTEDEEHISMVYWYELAETFVNNLLADGAILASMPEMLPQRLRRMLGSRRISNRIGSACVGISHIKSVVCC